MVDKQTVEPEKKPRIKRGRNISSRMMTYFVTHPDQVVTVQTLARSLRVTEKQVRDSITATRWANKDNEDHPSRRIQTIVRASSWKYSADPDSAGDPGTEPPAPVGRVVRATPVAEKKIFEEVGPVADGYVIQDEDGTLYRAKKL